MYRLLFIQFIRSRTAVIGLALLFGAGLLSLYTGNQFIQKQEKIIGETEKYQQEFIQRYAQYNKDDFGLLMYYLRFAFINKPERLTALSIGQRDINSSTQFVTIRALEAQKYETDLVNPYHLMSGNLDLGFVVIYLFPLLIIAFTFNLLSEEKEGGAWRLIAAQSMSVKKLLWAKLGIRAVTVLTLLGLLLAIAIPVLQLAPGKGFLLFALLSGLYLLFWMALSMLIVSFQKRSGYNAVLLLALWLLFTLLLPAAVNNYLVNKYPVPEAFNTIIKNRDGYHKKWDVDKSVTMNRFYELYPQLKKYQAPGNTFSWLWYYAMWHMGDDEAGKDARAMQDKLRQREAASKRIAAFVPSMHTQLQLNQLASSGLDNYLAFLDSTARFHEKLRMYFYPKIFEAANVMEEDWSMHKVEYFKNSNCIQPAESIMPLLVSIILVSAFAFYNLRKWHAV